MTDIYVIKENDTLESIANEFNTSPMILKLLNGNKNIVYGEKIIVPRINNEIFDFYEVKIGDTLYNISKMNNINKELLAQLNGINVDDYIYPNQILLIPKKGTILYITAIGDTLNEIANGLKVNINDLIEQNNKIYLQPEQLIVYKNK